MDSDAALNEASGNLVTVDRTLFLKTVEYFRDEKLTEEFNDYLEAAGCNEVIVDVYFANLLKKFLVEKGRTDSMGKMIIMCSCGGGGGGGGSPTGVRG